MLLAVAAAAALAVWLLIRVTDAAQDIDEKAASIAESGRGINVATDSIVQLNRTNKLARSILESGAPARG